MIKKHLTLLCIFLFSLSYSQEVILPLRYNPQLLANSPKKISETMSKGGGMIELPFVDDFSSNHFIGNEDGNTVLWLDRNVYRNNSWAINPPTIGVATFDGSDQFGYPYDWDGSPQASVADTLTSALININYPASANIGLSFYFQPGGLGWPPDDDDGDSLSLEFYAPDLDEWFHVWGTQDQDFENFGFVYIPITFDRYLKEGFQFRFKNYGSVVGPIDVWHIDYIWLDQNFINQTEINNDVAFVRQENTLLNDYTAMPWEHYLINPSGFVRPDISLLLRNLNNGPRTLEGNSFKVFYEGSLFDEYNNTNSPQIPDTSTLEYVNSVALPPNNFVFAADNDTSAAFRVEFSHGVADFEPTSSNDTMSFTQNFSNYYAYDDGTAEVAYQNSQVGQRVAMRFVNHQPDSIWAVNLFVVPQDNDQEQAPFVLTLWNDGGNGPGEVIAEALHEVEYGNEQPNQFITYAFDNPVFLPAGNFYVGYAQSDIKLLLGLDRNTNLNPTRLYFSSNDAWFASNQPGSVMIRAVMQTLDYDPTAVDELFLEDIGIYPNPASQFVQLQTAYNDPLHIEIFDISGKLIKNLSVFGSTQIDVSDLDAGMYLIRLSDKSNQFSRTEKLIIQN